MVSEVVEESTVARYYIARRINSNGGCPILDRESVVLAWQGPRLSPGIFDVDLKFRVGTVQ